MGEIAYKDLKRMYWERFKDEIGDAEKYMDLSQEAEHLGKYIEAAGFRKIAKEEYTHAKFFKMLIKDDECQTQEQMETWQAWHRMINRLKSF